MDWLVSNSSVVTALGGLVTLLLGLWALGVKIKKALKHAVIDAVDDRFATRRQVQRLEEQIDGLALSVQTMTYQTGRILSFIEGEKPLREVK
jgi:hypothetical protein